jgi:hypothetical protein
MQDTQLICKQANKKTQLQKSFIWSTDMKGSCEVLLSLDIGHHRLYEYFSVKFL